MMSDDSCYYLSKIVLTKSASPFDDMNIMSS